MAPSPGDFAAGGFYFPLSTGPLDVVIDGWDDKTPQGIIFFGGNQPDEDSLVHPAAPGLFFGLAWTEKGTTTIDYQSQAQTTYGTRWSSKPIVSLSTGTTVEYEADAVSFELGGFTINVSVAAPGARLVHWLAWSGFQSEGTTVGGTGLGDIYDIAALGYRAFAALSMQMFSSGASRDSAASGAIYLSLGAACFPEESTALGNDNYSAITFCSPGTTSQGFTQKQHRVLDDQITLSVHSFVAGTYLDDVDHLRPYPDWDSEALRLTLFGAPHRSEVVWWDCESWIAAVTAPDLGASTVYSPPSRIEETQAALFFGTTGYGKEEQLGVNFAYTLGVLTENYQGCVAFDTGHGDAPADGTMSFYQSQEACLITSLSPGGGVRVASGEILGSDVALTGEVATNGSLGHNGMILWGKLGKWRPQIYRRILWP